mmetsp:Transcript_526/g.1233  ORF Transcript_526/g.1233 Transcript_526/m.1233 type:complete len:602 (-) Transcript_526:288-2093(-)
MYHGALFAFVALGSFSSTHARKPHIIHILADDLGWGELGYHNVEAGDDIQTPVIDALIKSEALELDRYYGEKICSPARSSLQTGRLGIHVNVQNVFPEVRNPVDPVGGYQGIPVNMTGVAEVLKAQGYSTHIVGKWDVGMATPEHSPWSRGYDTWLGYWHHSNDYWTQDETSCSTPDGNIQAVKDLWRYNATFSGPALEHQNSPSCDNDNQHPLSVKADRYVDSNQDMTQDGGEEEEKCVYEEDILMDEIEQLIRKYHNDSLALGSDAPPLFLFYSMHLVHMPLQVKNAILEKFDFIDDKWRQLMHAMVSEMDSNVGRIVDLLKETGIWDDALVVFHTDNGGEIMAQLCGGNNWPLRGGKFSNFEGGIRANAFVTGGFLPEHRRGVKEEGFMTTADWYATYAGLAGTSAEDLVDKKALKAHLPAIDSLDCWDMISGAGPLSDTQYNDKSVRSTTGVCRSEIPISDTSSIKPNGDGDTLVGGIIRNDGYKILVGAENKQFLVGQDVLTAPLWPNTTLPPLVPELHPKVCGRTPLTGCLFDVLKDPTESDNLAASNPELFFEMLDRIDALQETVYSPVRGEVDPQACAQAIENGMYWGPFTEI